MKLNLGCGVNKIEGCLNCDIAPEVKPDKILNLEEELPFGTNSVDEIHIYHVLEHINNFIPLMHELHRICKKGAIINVWTPFYAGWGQFNDPTHVRFFTPFTFSYFDGSVVDCGYEVKSEGKMFDTNVRLKFSTTNKSFLNIFNPLINISHRYYCRFFAWIFPATEIIYTLKVIK